jgi:hypothetical protein
MQAEEERGYGVGVEFQCRDGDAFVQWARNDDGTLALVEVKVPDAAPPHVAEQLVARGFAPHHDAELRQLRILVCDSATPLAASSTDDGLVATLTSLIATLGPVEGATFTAYP